VKLSRTGRRIYKTAKRLRPVSPGPVANPVLLRFVAVGPSCAAVSQTHDRARSSDQPAPTAKPTLRVVSHTPGLESSSPHPPSRLLRRVEHPTHDRVQSVQCRDDDSGARRQYQVCSVCDGQCQPRARIAQHLSPHDCCGQRAIQTKFMIISPPIASLHGLMWLLKSSASDEGHLVRSHILKC
jgi:hypothetical protein